MTLHGDYGRFGKARNWLVKSAIRMANEPIVINAKSYEKCKGFNKNTRLISAFIPPQNVEPLQNEAKGLLENFHAKGKRIVSTNASNTAVDKHGNDIYGIDFLVEYYKKSTDDVLVVSDPSGNYKARYAALQSTSVCFIDYPHPYFEVLKRADVFVRNTSTDGDALSVKEALYLGIPALCTDVVDRPEGVRLFKYCDKESFEQAMNSPVEGNGRIENGAEKIVEVYRG